MCASAIVAAVLVMPPLVPEVDFSPLPAKGAAPGAYWMRLKIELGDGSSHDGYYHGDAGTDAAATTQDFLDGFRTADGVYGDDWPWFVESDGSKVRVCKAKNAVVKNLTVVTGGALRDGPVVRWVPWTSAP